MKLSLPKTFNIRYYISYIVIAIAAAVLSVLTFMGALPMSTLFLLENITMNIVLAVSLSLVVGFLGELSLGHAGFMCIGAYAGGILSQVLHAYKIIDGKSILNVLLSLILGAAVAGVFGFLIGLPALRLKGDYLAIVTLAFGEIVKTVLQNITFKINGAETGGPIGVKTPRFDKDYLFIIGFVLVLLTLAVIQNLIRSKHGRAITAIRDNEIAAHATGINVTKYKLCAFIISAALAGAAGVFYSFSQNNVSASVFDYNYSIEILIMVVIGGMGNISGTIISATLITYLNNVLATVLTGDLAVLKNLIYALILVAMIIYNNAPALKGIRDKFNYRTITDKFRKLVRKTPEKYVDDDGAWNRVPTKIEMNEVLSVDIVVNESTKDPDKGGKNNE